MSGQGIPLPDQEVRIVAKQFDGLVFREHVGTFTEGGAKGNISRDPAGGMRWYVQATLGDRTATYAFDIKEIIEILAGAAAARLRAEGEKEA